MDWAPASHQLVSFFFMSVNNWSNVQMKTVCFNSWTYLSSNSMYGFVTCELLAIFWMQHQLLRLLQHHPSIFNLRSQRVQTVKDATTSPQRRNTQPACKRTCAAGFDILVDDVVIIVLTAILHRAAHKTKLWCSEASAFLWWRHLSLQIGLKSLQIPFKYNPSDFHILVIIPLNFKKGFIQNQPSDWMCP